MRSRRSTFTSSTARSLQAEWASPVPAPFRPLSPMRFSRRPACACASSPSIRPSSRLDRALPAKLGPAVEPLLHLDLVAVSHACVEGLALHAVREVVLARERLLV